MKRLLLPVIPLLAALWSSPAAAQTRSPLGTNIEGLDDWSTEFTFVDAFKMSRPWFSASRTAWQDDRPLDLDARGWVRSLQPGQWARTLMFWELGRAPGQYPRGQYVVTYQGEGTLEYGGGALLVQSAPGRHVLDVDPNRAAGIFLAITATNPANYVRNIQVRLPVQVPDGEIFYPPFLDTLRNYRTIRFINWMLGQQNHIVQEHWEDRSRIDDARWAGPKGAPVEIMVQLANRLNADPWFTIHHLSDENFVRQFARLVRQQLNPNLKIYIENSDELWNLNYRQARYAQQQGLAMGLSTDPYQAQIRWHALRSRQIFEIFEQEFPRDRLVRVLSSFHASPATTEMALSYGGVAAHTDAVAIAPYVGIPLPLQTQALGWSVDELLRQMDVTVMPQIMTWVRDHRAIAARYGVPIVSYEGGQSLVAVGPLQGNAALNDLYTAANRDPRMGALYTRYLQAWSDATGGALFMHLGHCFRYDQYGRFGSLEYLTQPRSEAPKYDALQRWMEGAGSSPPGPSCGSLAAPGALAFTAGGGRVVLTWLGVAGAASYVLEVGSSPGLSNLGVYDTGSTATSFTAANVARGTYYIRIRARSACATGPVSSEVAVVVP